MLPVGRRIIFQDNEDESTDESFQQQQHILKKQMFKRKCSKVFYASDKLNEDWSNTTSIIKESNWEQIINESPTSSAGSSSSGGPPSHRSQDSGFSDSESEASPPAVTVINVGHPVFSSTPKTSRTPQQLRKFSQINKTKYLHTSRNPVQKWLEDTREMTDLECMTTLEGKSIAPGFTKNKCNSRLTGARDAIRSLQQRAHLISTEFAKLCQYMERNQLDKTGPLAECLVEHVSEFVRSYQAHHARYSDNIENNQEYRRLLKDESALVAASSRLQLLCEQQDDETSISKDQLASVLATLGHAFTKLVDRVLSHEIKCLVSVLEQPSPTELQLRASLAGLAVLGHEGSHLNRLIAKCGGVRALLSLCLDSSEVTIRIASLRVLAIVCSVIEGIKQLDQSGGMEIIADLLKDTSKSNAELAEAASVLTQVTAQGLEGNLHLETLSHHIDSLTQSLARLIIKTDSIDYLLLSLAAVTNLSFLEPIRSVDAIIKLDIIDNILKSVNKIRNNDTSTLFIFEQAATLLANISSIPEGRNMLIKKNKVIVTLLRFLSIKSVSKTQQRPAEITAAERVQQKSAIALSRLCSDTKVSEKVVELEGAERLVELCKDENERNHSDAVLVACLSALRKVSTNCGNEVIEKLNAQELIAPRLLDSFLLYSSRQESYV